MIRDRNYEDRLKKILFWIKKKKKKGRHDYAVQPRSMKSEV